MAELTPILQQAERFLQQHAPESVLEQAVPAAILCLFFGVGVSVLGARMARFAATLAFAAGGGAVGYYFAGETGFPPPLCLAGGALVVGIIGYQTFRIWVGLATAVALTLAAMGVFSYQRAMPHVAAFEPTSLSVSGQGEAVFAPPSPGEQQAYKERTPRRWLAEFWSFLQARDAAIARHGRMLLIGAALTGLCLGVVAMRWSLIFSTSLAGTALVMVGMGTLLSTLARDELYQAVQKHPSVVGLAVGGFMLTSVILQTMLTRPAPLPKTAPKPKSRA